MSESPGPANRNVPLLVASGVVLVAAVVAIAVGVNGAANATPTPLAQATATPGQTPSESAATTSTPTALNLPATPCSTASFGPTLQPLNQPSSVHTYSAAPAQTIDATKLYEMTITTAKGAIVLCLQPSLAPVTVNAIVTLARNHFYDGIPFHRVCPNAADNSCGGSLTVIQGGDPTCIDNVGGTGCGSGGPGFTFKDEPVNGNYVAGALAMANSGANTNGSQFFICSGDDSSLPKNYNLFGHVAGGAAVLPLIARGDVMQSVTVTQQT